MVVVLETCGLWVIYFHFNNIYITSFSREENIIKTQTHAFAYDS